MPINHQGAITTTLGLRASRPPRCMKCGKRKDGLFTVNANGQEVCADCAAPKNRAVLVGESCGPDCTCSPECRENGER